MSNFESLGLCNNILKVIKNEGYDRPTPVQELAIPFDVRFGKIETSYYYPSNSLA